MRTYCEEPIHEWFELSYANYLVLPRSVLQSCSQKAQYKLVEALRMIEEEMKEAGVHWPTEDQKIKVSLRDLEGRFSRDEFSDYQRGRRRLW